MEVELQLKKWNVAQDEKTRATKIVGTYAIVANGKEIAKQEFNAGGYGDNKEIPFSAGLMDSVRKLENDIMFELKAML